MSKTQRFRAKHIDQTTLNNWSVLGITMHHPSGSAVYWHSDWAVSRIVDRSSVISGVSGRLG